MTEEQLILGEYIFNSVYELRDKREADHDIDKHTNEGETPRERLNESIRKNAWNQGYRHALEDVLNVLRHKL